MSGPHWGEIPKPPVSDFFLPDVTADIERSMDKFCLSEYNDDTDAPKTDKLLLSPMDPLMIYSISLHKYMNDMTEMIRVADTKVYVLTLLKPGTVFLAVDWFESGCTSLAVLLLLLFNWLSLCLSSIRKFFLVAAEATSKWRSTPVDSQYLFGSYEVAFNYEKRMLETSSTSV
ncbi:hypothetical protein NQ315_012589 [Exocentrus adspersus]|uniref:Uncharacterized protein n=1 Tax=Exocentrus adspersus TaxID=1586481 RepID=A0AAV8VST2_9CUCU|nr:hypothetical protein NQ315_012589 [Exocentrus adspersus]